MREASLRLDALAGGAVLCFFGGIAFVHKLLDEPAVRERHHIKVVFRGLFGLDHPIGPAVVCALGRVFKRESLVFELVD